MAHRALTLHQRHTAWLAIWAFVLGALMPAVSAWVMSARLGNNWVEVCTQQGAKWVMSGVAKADASSPDTQGKADHKAHCPFCVLQDHSPVVPPTATVAMPSSVQAHAQPLLFLHAPRPLFAWSPSLARAPPALA
jgi:Protein of unknown function (DUF2946)